MRFDIHHLGLVDYTLAWRHQREALEQVKSGVSGNILIVCRHHPVITVGRSGSRGNILADDGALARAGLPVVRVERGGDVTYHGPGQITVYPVFNLAFLKKDIHWFLRTLEDAGLLFLRGYGVRAERWKGLTGLWVGEKKIASIGIAVRQWIACHGISINLAAYDLEGFSFIRPCGMDIKVTSVESESGRAADTDEAARAVTEAVAEAFG